MALLAWAASGGVDELMPLLVFGEFDEDTAGGFGMQKSDALSFGARARGVVYEHDAGGATASEGGVGVIDGETDMMKSRTAFLDKLSDGRLRRGRLEQFDQR